MAREKAVLAYSGGLDTSVCIKWLIEEKNLDVIAVIGDVGQARQSLDFIQKKALETGAVESLVIDMRDEFVEEYLTRALFANALYENKYPLVSALSRPVIVKHLVEVAQQYGARFIAHGCTVLRLVFGRLTQILRSLPLFVSGICSRAMQRLNGRKHMAFTCRLPRLHRIRLMIIFGVALWSAAFLKIPGPSLPPMSLS